ncbi:MAG: hypothetical protein ACOC8B_04225, partial [Gemmatimonadota bacterium]
MILRARRVGAGRTWPAPVGAPAVAVARLPSASTNPNRGGQNMLIKRPDEIPSSEITPESVYLNRRRFI